MTFPQQNPLGWLNLVPLPGTEGDIHVIPNNDIEPHDISEGCWCHPVDAPDSEDFVWIHNSKDGRETYELGRKLN